MKILVFVALMPWVPVFASDVECLNEGTLESIKIQGDEVEFEVRDFAKMVTLAPGKTGAPVGDEPGGVVPGGLRRYSASLKGSAKAVCENPLLKTLLQARDRKKAVCVQLDPGRVVRAVSLKKDHSVMVPVKKGNH